MAERAETDKTDGGWNAPLPEMLPKPTAAPIVVAFGTCLLAWGIVTSWIVSAVGLILFAVGIRGWIVELRDEQRRKRSAGGAG